MGVRDASEFDGFFLDKENDRCIHVGWESESVIYVDVFDSVEAAWNAEKGKSLSSVLVDLITGKVTIEGG